MASELKRTRGPDCISDLRFDRMLAGELGASERAALDAHAQGCAPCRARLHELRAARTVEDAALAAEANALYARSVGSQPPARRRAPVAALSAGLALVALAAGLWLALAPAPDAREALRFKGAHGFGFYVQRGAAVYRGAPGEALRPGDRVRFVARSSEDGYLAVLSLDGARRASVYYPAGLQAAKLDGGALEQALPASVQLDDVLGPEHWYALFCHQPLALASLRGALERAGEGFAAPPGCALEHVRVDKVGAP